MVVLGHLSNDTQWRHPNRGETYGAPTLQRMLTQTRVEFIFNVRGSLPRRSVCADALCPGLNIDLTRLQSATPPSPCDLLTTVSSCSLFRRECYVRKVLSYLICESLAKFEGLGSLGHLKANNGEEHPDFGHRKVRSRSPPGCSGLGY